MTNKVLIWINIILFLVFLLLVFEMREKEFDIYSDDTLQYFGTEKTDIIDKYGNPDYADKIGGPGGDIFIYKDEKIGFIFAGDGSVVNNLELFPGREFLGVEIGMTFDEIIEVLGFPRSRTYDHYDDDYTMVYYLGEKIGGMGEIEIWFSAKADDAPTEKAQIFWKKFWE
jgi:hypothetical protein